jgi:hypothetical protein
MAIDPNNPFNFAYPPGQNFWGAAQLASGGGPEPTTHGATHSWSSISAGVYNTADNFFSGSGTDAGNSPFNYGNSLSGYDGPGNSYVASIANLPSPISPTANGGSGQSGPDSLGDVTVVNTAVGMNPTFAADNVFGGTGSIGLYGRSRGASFSIGVMGQSSTGCGILGLATDENSKSRGIGVVGRSVGGQAAEVQSVEDVMAAAIGVLGQATDGSGVRGHGGPLLPIPFAASLIVETTPNVATLFDLALGAIGSPASANIVAPPPPPADGTLTPPLPGATLVDFQPGASLTAGKEASFQYTLTNPAGTSQPATVTIVIVAANPAAPVSLPAGLQMQVSPSPLGGVFSAGRLESQQIPLSGLTGKAKGGVLQQVSRDPSAQFQLVPFVSFSETIPPKLPLTGQVGDLFLCVIQTQKQTSDTPQKAAAQLWLCTGYVQDKTTGNALPQWQPVQMGVTALSGGTAVPLSATPWT